MRTPQELIDLIPVDTKGRISNPRMRHLRNILEWEHLDADTYKFIESEILIYHKKVSIAMAKREQFLREASAHYR